MRQELNDTLVEQVVGGTVRFSGSDMLIQFTVLGETFSVKNCSDAEAMSLIVSLYAEYKTKGNRAFETATKAAFQSRGWL